MGFENENTFIRMKNTGREKEFHSKYEDALHKVQGLLGKKYPIFINGEEIYTEKFFDVRSPADSEILMGSFSSASKEDVADAIEAASEAFEDWRSTDYRQRAAIVKKAAEIASLRKFELAAAMTLENGKNRYEAMADVDEAIDFMRYYSEQLLLNKGYSTAMGSSGPGEENKSVLNPYGVWGIIAPFNFPLSIACGMSTGAIITGNTAVLKPSSSTPYMSLMLTRIYAEAGLPHGVLNLVTGSGSVIGKGFTEHELVSGMAFTGSREVGVELFRKFNEKRFRPLIAEMGGKNAVIVMESADMDRAAEGTARAAFGFGGQKCSAASRLIVVGDAKSRLMKKLVEYTRKLKIGFPAERETFLGPLINREAVEKYERAVAEAKELGKILVGGERVTEGRMARGHYVTPVIVDNIPPDSRLFREELFLPFLCVTEAANLDEAIEMANSVDYGLTAGIFSEKQEEIEHFFANIEAGVCYANKRAGATTGAMVGAQPFVGWKMSGSTGKGAGGIYYLPQFMREQTRAVFQ